MENFVGESCLLKFARRTVLDARPTRMLLLGSLQLGQMMINVSFLTCAKKTFYGRVSL
jgi:hypothetical protein